MTSRDLLQDLFDYVGFDEADRDVLQRLGPILEPRFDGLVDDFYAVIVRTPRAAAAFRDGPAQVERQKVHLRGWLDGIFAGRYDAEYLERRERIGRTHVRIRLEQRFMFGAMNVVRRGLHAALGDSSASAEDRARGHAAIDKICDVELAIMLETYRDRYVEQQRAQERLATLGQLAASIGHELRNPLAVIATSAHLLRKHADEGGARHLDKIARQVELGERIIGDLLALAGDRPPAREPVDLRALIDDVRESLIATGGIEIAVDVDAKARSVDVDGLQMRQVLANLLLNAVQALEPRGSGRVELRARIEDRALCVDVLDDGPGFPEGLRERVFEPLFTTKPGGIGLGLALTARIVQKHGGTIEARERDGGGAHVRLSIPEVVPS
ncbi:MAG: ATP-binding protein [Sandaracinaceae bacterium]|nr:ATP-binding protein [Sandaracinaceae bacterium]